MQRTASTCNLCTPEPHTTTQPGPSWIHDSQKLWKIIKWLLFQVTKFWHDLLPSIRCHGITNSRGKSKNSDRFYFLGLWITVDGDCSHEFKRCLLLGRKTMTNLDSVWKSRDISLPTKVHIFKVKVKVTVVSNSLWPHGQYNPWNSPGQNTGVGNLSLLQGTFSTQGSNTGLPHRRQILYQLSHKGSPRILEQVAYPISSGSSQSRNQPGSPPLQTDSLPTELSGKPW